MAYAVTGALLHDIGRFRQYKDYKTFIDASSVDHAKEGISVLRDEHMLECLSDEEKTVILNIVGYHNVFELPQMLAENTLFLLKIVRDADKIDVLRVVTDHYLKKNKDSDSYLHLGLKNDDGVSYKVIQSIADEMVVNSQYVKQLNDLKFLQISWVFGLNFHESIIRIQKKTYIEKILSTLPESEYKKKVTHAVNTYIKKKSAEQVLLL